MKWTTAPVRAALVVLIVLVLAGCPKVPPETVKLSYQIGEDLDVIYRSYDAMVVSRFADYRARRLSYLENEWTPMFLEDWVKNGMLVETAKGQVVWSDEADDFVPPTPGQEKQQMLATIREWSDSAVAEIELKRHQLLDPLDEAEKAIREDLRDAFNALRRANAQITAHLNSIRKVQEVQSTALDKLGLKTVVDQLDVAIVQASENAAKGLEKIREADGLVDEATAAGGELFDAVTGGNP